MRKGALFALGMCAAALLGLVSLTLAEQVQSSAAPSPGKQMASPHTDPQAVPSSPQTGNQRTAQKTQVTTTPSQQTGKQTSGQKTPAARPPAIPPGYRLLSLNEGRAIVQGMAWTDDEEGLSPDCSHLVHKLYEQAGHPYPYASSLDLYWGTGPFFRVRFAHPGDLVVWRGHVGIVVSPREHAFFSTTNSGTRIQDYRSAYWRARGYPHFFRYLTKSPRQASGSASEAVNHSPQH